MKIVTRGEDGGVNGWLLPIWNAQDEKLGGEALRPDQVYLTAVAPMSRKGPHLHMKRRGMFVLVSGNAYAWVRKSEGGYEGHILAVGEAVIVAPGDAAAFYNSNGAREALIINMPSPAWTPEEPDEHPVWDWEDPDWWQMLMKKEDE